MPKKYSNEEKEYLVIRLKQEALKCLTQYGIKGTTVDELIKRVQIPKGTFYLFFESKEVLILSVFIEQRNLVEMKIFRGLSAIDNNSSVETISEFLLSCFKEAASNPVIRLWNSDEIEHLKRKLSKDALNEYFGNGNGLIDKMLSFVNLKMAVDKNLAAESIKALFTCYVMASQNQSEQFDNAMQLIISGSVSKLIN